MTFSDLEGQSFQLFEAFLNFILEKMQHVFATICLLANQKASVIRDFNCRVETGGLLKVTCSHVQL